jgi:hypothetical protein
MARSVQCSHDGALSEAEGGNQLPTAQPDIQAAAPPPTTDPRSRGVPSGLEAHSHGHAHSDPHPHHA